MKQHCDHTNSTPVVKSQHPVNFGGGIALSGGDGYRLIWCRRCGAIGIQEYPNRYKGAGFRTLEWVVPELCKGAK